MIQRNVAIHSHFTRIARNIRSAIFKTSKAQNSINSKATIEFNALPNDIKEENNIIVFKKKLKLYIKNNNQ